MATEEQSKESNYFEHLSDLHNLENEYPTEKILVLGYGNFGTCLAFHLAGLKNEVTIWARNTQVVNEINTNHKNTKYMKDILLPENIKAVSEITKEFLNEISVIVLAIPTQHMRVVLKMLKDLELSTKQLIICTNKGIETETFLLPNAILSDVLGKEIASKSCFLSGPSFACEIVQKLPTAVSVACEDAERASWAQQVFHSPFFRVYTVADPTGVEIAGALKNVVAIASGLCSGLGFHLNTRAALLTRGLNEITTLGVALGANPITFLSLAGIGDLFLTCTSQASRNFTVGYRLGKGETLDDIIRTLGSVAEGVPTTKGAFLLAQKLVVDTPIINQIYAILYEQKPIKEALRNLLTLEKRPEFNIYYNHNSNNSKK
eukprot:TRINITY_DN2152_c2_g1_i1.p1 TRINITY_DN2152_c2_g1~~TRINITY_DN2152_c2_g1_i1.p1  ORF type:complete len:376 (-),score=144.26 TRINITY_DN2152_c2_g1_i1:102-1229(-)